MPVIFFEGFNWNDGEAVTLNPAYWSNNRGYGFSTGRTQNAVRMPWRTEGTALSGNSWLNLSGFADPLATYSCLGIGFWINGSGLKSAHTGYTEATFENLMSLSTNNGTLSIDLGRPTDGIGVLLVVRENGTTINSYDFRSAPGNSWSHQQNNWGSGGIGYIGNDMYLDFFFDAANGSFSVRAAGGNTLSTPLYNSNGAATTAITSFSSLTSVKLYGQQYTSNYAGGDRYFDDFYLAAGNAVSDVFLGPNTRVWRTGPENMLLNEWARDNANTEPAYALQSNNGDSNYIKSTGTGQKAYFTLGDLYSYVPEYVAGVKIFNVVRKSGLDNQSMVNIMASASGDTPQEIGPTYSIPSETYSLKESIFFTNPLTSSEWTKTAVNNMVLGVKNVT